MIYKIPKSTKVDGSPVIDSILMIDEHNQTWLIPFNEANTDYQEYLKWVAKGNTPEPAEAAE
jgi:hypothetical protein